MNSNALSADAPLIDRLCELAAHVHAAHAELAGLAAEVDATDAWCGEGYRSCAHWFTVTTGVDERTAGELLRVGHALRELPLLRSAACAGRLSLDKLRLVTQVATPADEDIWLNIAVSASGMQFVRICRAYMRTARADPPVAAAERREQRGVVALWRDDGMIELRALLPADDGALVLRALDAVRQREAAERAAAAPSDRDAVLEPRAAERADALVSICEQVLSGEEPVVTSAHRLVVHVDTATLVSGDPRGRCHVEDGSGLPAAVARRLGCDTELVAVVERDGVPIGVGRARRVVSGRLRHALRVRDRHCRFPGCGVPASRTHGHHLQHWADGGRTELRNLLSLCGFHHRRLHDGEYTVAAGSKGTFRFVSAQGKPIADPDAPPVVTAPGTADLRTLLRSTEPITASSAFAPDGGIRLDLGYITGVLSDACASRVESSSHAPPGPVTRT